MGSLGGIPLDVGDVLAKKYRLERLVGEGGTGIVVAARHVQLDQPVAIKFLRTALASEEIRLRFEREARAISKIESEHVVLVLDVGAVDDATPYMVMEYLEGRDLARVLKEDGTLAVGDAVDCMLQVCEALEQAHAAGIVHRDLKPANLFLTRREDGGPHVKVVDFGISKILDKKILEEGRGPAEVTNQFTVLGSPRYMAPEQLRSSKDVDSRADLWSVGAVLFQLVTGKHAFAAESNVEASLAVLTKEPARLSEVAPDAPAALSEIIQRCLTKDVSARFQSARELASALRPLASDQTRDSLEQMRSAKVAPSHDVPVSPASVSEAVMPTSPSAFRVAQARAAEDDEPVARVRRAFVRSPSRALKLVIVGGGLVAVLLAFGILSAAKLAAQSLGILSTPEAELAEPALAPDVAGAAAAGPEVAEPAAAPTAVATTLAPPSEITIPLDAGRARP